MSLPNIYELNQKYYTNKADHCFCGVGFLDIYDKYLGQNRENVRSVLEIGVKEGQSLKLWSEYFPNAKIRGIDITPKYNGDGNRISVYKGSQEDPILLNQVIKDADGIFDVIIDDGSHINELTIKTFNYIWPHLKSKGLYFIEDLRCCYVEPLEQEMKDGGWPGLNENKQNNVNLVNRREDMDKFFLEIIKNMDYLKKDVMHLDFWPMIAVLQKC